MIRVTNSGCEDLAIVTSYYNPQHYQSRRENFHCFRRGIESSGASLFVVENAFREDTFELDDFSGLQRIRGGDVLWQKERILNLALSNIPQRFKKIAWLDCDVLFENHQWAHQASRILNEFPVIQLYDSIVRLPRETSERIRSSRRPLTLAESAPRDESWKSFATVAKESPQLMIHGDFAAHGHTGFAWAIRREVVNKIGFYDACIAGSGDHMMAHAFCGDWDSKCIDRILGENNKHKLHFQKWCERIYPRVKSRIGFVPGTIYHLWHGETQTRRYVLRNRELAAFSFDPDLDIRIGKSGLWEWTDGRCHLRDWAENYFKQRNEDGEAISA